MTIADLSESLTRMGEANYFPECSRQSDRKNNPKVRITVRSAHLTVLGATRRHELPPVT